MPAMDKSRNRPRQKGLTYTLADAGIELPKALTTQKQEKNRNKSIEGNTPSPLQGNKIMTNTHSQTVTTDQAAHTPVVPPAGGIEHAQGMVNAMAKRLDEREKALLERETAVSFKKEALDIARFSIKVGIVAGTATAVIYIARGAARSMCPAVEVLDETT